MKDLPLQIFVFPALAVMSVTLLFNFTRKREINKITYNKFVLRMIFISFIVNLVWELLQGPLYKGFSFGFHHIFICTLGSLADTIMVMLIYFVLAFVYKNNYWFLKASVSKIILLILIGTLGAIGGEIWHTASGNWSYATNMPILPLVNVGLLPILQFMLLPTIIYFISYMNIKIRNRINNFN